jgi:DNA-directed RNA polymerase specialized sigma24 family protein
LAVSEEAFDGFVRAASPGLLRAAWLLVGDWSAAEDLVQTAFEKTWPRWGRLPDDKQRLAYLHRVLTNAFLRGQRRRWMGEIASGDLPHQLPMRPTRCCFAPASWPLCADCRRGSAP